jgi:Ca2+-transporting ATPase
MPSAHAEPAGEVLGRLEVDAAAGLSDGEARGRLERHGPNRLETAERKSALAILLDQFRSLVFALLFFAAVASTVVGELVQGVAIVVAILINAAIGFATELRAARSMEALGRLDRMTARVCRGSEAREIDAARLVPGDVVLLRAGEVVPADLRLIETETLRIDESALTGESVPVDKVTEALEAELEPPERTNMAFRGTAVAQGEGVGVVTATGRDTEIGRIAELTEEAEADRTPLEKRLDTLSRRLLVVILVVAALVSAVGILAGREVLLMIETGVALVVAAVPEGLPIVASIALARGMWRLAARDALVERLSAVETLGATNVICTDKTGTLTENRMTLGRLMLADGPVEVSRGEPAFSRGGEATGPEEDAALRAALEVAALCNAAQLADGDRPEEGDPMEIALLEGARLGGIERGALLERSPELRDEPFDPDARMMARFHEAEGGVRVAVKGAPEAVLEVSARVLGADGEARELAEGDREGWREATEEMAGAGLRTLALAEKTVESAEAEPYAELTLIGVAGLEDPPREGVREAVLECRRAGIRAVMVTGDQPSTARAIAAEVGLVDDAESAEVVLGSELGEPDALAEEERERLLRVPVFARLTPEQKLDLIGLYQTAGLVVAMTGDGVNDAPALKKADIGVAMGRRGTEIARETAAMVLRNDSFASIVNAVREGRRIFENIRNFVIYMLSGNIAEIIAVTTMALAQGPLPLLPLQILFINIVSDVFPALALGLGESTGQVMRRPPRDPAEPVLTRGHWGVIGGYGALIAASVMAAFGAAFWMGMSGAEAVTVSFLAFGFARLWHVFNMRAPGTGLLRNEVTLNPWVWVALGIGVALLLAAAYVPPLAAVLETAPPGPAQWGLIAAGSLAPLALGQLVKWPALRAALGRGGGAET